MHPITHLLLRQCPSMLSPAASLKLLFMHFLSEHMTGLYISSSINQDNNPPPDY